MIKPCPFCHMKPLKVRQLKEDDGLYSVFCDLLICKANPTIGGVAGFDTPEKALDAWNDRRPLNKRDHQ